VDKVLPPCFLCGSGFLKPFTTENTELHREVRTDATPETERSNTWATVWGVAGLASWQNAALASKDTNINPSTSFTLFMKNSPERKLNSD
jgi:hypothetical protein